MRKPSVSTEPAEREEPASRPSSSEPADEERSRARPLYVDLDGTLVATDLLWEALRTLVREHPITIFRAPFWLAAGRARLKREWAERVSIPVADLPYRPEVVAYVEAARDAGRLVVLASASPEPWVRAVADHMALFDDVLATAGDVNLKATVKRDAIAGHLGRIGRGSDFEYVGDAQADFEIWRAAGAATLAGGGDRIEARLRDAGLPVQRLGPPTTAAARMRAFVRALRPHQWVKNALLLLPLLLAHRIADIDRLAAVAIAIATFCGVASGTYLLNDVMDVAADRRHASKRRRPFASGSLPLALGFALGPVLIVAALGVSWAVLPGACTAMLAGYAALTLAYTFVFKEKLLLDVMILAGLYTHRILAGGVVADVAVSPWLLAFSSFFFLSLALAKRYVELAAAAGLDQALSNRRAYRVDDLPLVGAMGVSSAFISVLVLCLFVSASNTSALYTRPAVLWALCPVTFYWIARVWMLARRGELHEDPVVFAITDPVSWLIAACMAATIVGASW